MISRLMFAPILCSLLLTGCDEQKRMAEKERGRNIKECLRDHTPEQCALLYPPIFVPATECKCECVKPEPIPKAEQ